MQYSNDEEKFGYTKAELLGKIATSLAGRAAELVYYGEDEGLTTGASSDIRSATIYAKQIICTYGMSKEFGLSSLYGDENTPIYPELRKEINKILEEQLQRGVKLIQEGREVIDKVVYLIYKCGVFFGGKVLSYRAFFQNLPLVNSFFKKRRRKLSSGNAFHKQPHRAIGKL